MSDDPDPAQATPPTAAEGAGRRVPSEEALRELQKWVEAAQQKAAAEEQAETEAKAVLDRIEHNLPVVEQRTERLMHHYGL
jgi:hypothetical protein